MYKEDNDYELLYLIAEKDEIAYNKIYNKYNTVVKNMAKKLYNKTRYIGCSIEDIYEAGLYGLNLAINNFHEGEGILFYTCAVSFIHKEMISFIRENNRNKHNILSECISLNKEIDEDGKSIESFVGIGDNHFFEYFDMDILKTIIDFKHNLPFLYSLVYELRINNFNNKEISILLDIKYKTLDNIMRYIKDKLKKELNIIEAF